MRIYIETSVWSFAFADDSPDYRDHTLLFFGRCRSGQIEPVISTVVLEEIEAAAEPKRSQLAALVREVDPALIPLTPEAARLADFFVSNRAVPASKPADARHVAAAFTSGLDVLVSWNFKHIANVRRADRFNALAAIFGLMRTLRIASPPEVIYDPEP